MAKTTPLSEKLGRNVFFGTSPDLPRIIEVDLARLRENPDQPRKEFDQAALQELADSIARHGLIQPIAVAPDPNEQDGFIVVAGGRRFRAFKLMDRETIPAIITEGNPDEIALIENIQRQDLNPLEEAEALARMMDRHGYTQGELGKVIGKRQNTVSEALSLNSLPQLIEDEYRTSDTSSSISKSVLIEIARIDDEADQLALWEQVKGGNGTVRAARQSKKKPGSGGRAESSPAKQLLTAGKSFARKLEQMDPQDLVDDEAQYAELVELRNKIDELVDGLQMSLQK